MQLHRRDILKCAHIGDIFVFKCFEINKNNKRARPINKPVHLLFSELKENVFPASVKVEHLIQRGDYSCRSQQQPFAAHCFPRWTHCYWFPSSYEVPLAKKTAWLSVHRASAHTWHGGESWRKTQIDTYTLWLRGGNVRHMQKSYVWIIFTKVEHSVVRVTHACVHANTHAQVTCKLKKWVSKWVKHTRLTDKS